MYGINPDSKAIVELRGQGVMLAFHLAELYGVKTKVLIQSVSRNIKRFPTDFMFQLSQDEFETLRSQYVTSKSEKRGGTRYLPNRFTEHGITILSSVLRSDTAIQVNINILRTLILLKQYNHNFKLLQERIDKMESMFNGKIENIHEVIEFLLSKPEPEIEKPKKRMTIGFRTQE